MTAEVCTIPLSGIQLVEASAGTGKTHVIVGLYLRALAVLALPVDSVLLVSYTVAATAELRLRVQRRLLQAAAWAASAAPEADADPELTAILDEARAAQAEPAAVLAARLAQAPRALDRARIQTIHGWARGVAADEALALGLPLDAVFVEDESVAARQALADAWRATLEDPESASIWTTLEGPQAVWEELAPALLAPGEAVDPAPETLVARLGVEARRRLLERRARRACYGVDEVLERLSVRLADPMGRALAERLAARHPLVLIDEFQDADARQYAIFRALQRAGGRALLLVGDPKQAIYRFRGGDVDTYLAARQDAVVHRLRRNWRARPALIAGLNALYVAAGGRAFSDDRSAGEVRKHLVDAGMDRGISPQDAASTAPATGQVRKPGGIGYEPLIPAGQIDDTALRCTAPALLPAALCFAHLPGAPRVLGDRALGEQWLARHAAQLLAHWLAAAASGALLAEGGVPRIAVLAENHAQLDGLAAALTARGVPFRRRATRARGRPIEADWLACWLTALIDPVPARWHALRDTPFAHVGTAADAALALLAHQAETLRRTGLLAALDRALCAGSVEASRLLPLAESLMLRADPQDPQALLEALDTAALLPEPEPADAAPVVVLSTVHAAKGLEFDLVLLPYTGARARGQPATATPAELRAQREERLRNLYVALTRARLGVVVGLDLLGSRNDLPALYHLLGADEAGGSPAQAARRAVEALAAPGTLGLLVWPALEAAARPSPAVPPTEVAVVLPSVRPAAAPAMASYSSLILETADGRGSAKWSTAVSRMMQRVDPAEPDAIRAVEADPELAGAGFGSAVHAVLEHADFAAWAGVGPLPDREAARLDAILARLPSLDPAAARRQAVAQQVRAALNAPLPEGLRLCALPANERRAELPFTLRLKDPQGGAAELARLAQSLRPAGISGAELRPPIGSSVGWLTGLIDLVYRHAGRWYLLDWKSNRLRPEHLQAGDGLARAVAESGYELQILLYAVALDRWLTARWTDYCRERHFGGVRWLYLRALDDTGRGIYAPPLPAALLDAAAGLIGPTSGS